jgi:uncharacterized protein YigE (DUF2233 family)
MKTYRERGRTDTEVRRGPALLSPGKRSASTRAYGSLPATRDRDEAAPSAAGRPRLVGPGWGTFMPSLDEQDQAAEARSGLNGSEIDGREEAELEAGPDETADEAQEAEAARQPAADPDQDAQEPEAAEERTEESADENAEESAGPEGAGQEERGADPQAVASAEAATVDQQDGRDARGDARLDAAAPDASERDEDGGDDAGENASQADADNNAGEIDSPDAGGNELEDSQPDAGDRDLRSLTAAPRARRLAVVDAGQPVQARASRSRGARATASRLGPIDPPIPRPPRKKRKPSFDRVLRGGGWRRVGLPGVRMKRVGTTTILAIDRSAKGVKLDTTSVQGRFSLPTQARRQKAEIALNGDLFNFRTGKPSGLHRRRGRNLSGTKREAGTGMFAFGDGRAGILSGSNRLPRWADNVVSGRPIIMRNGTVVKRFAPADAPRLNGETGRSAVGLSRNGRVLFLAASSGIATKKLAQLLKKNGVDDALALDGSGSAQMFVHGKGMVKRGDGRPIGNAILVHTRR